MNSIASHNVPIRTLQNVSTLRPTDVLVVTLLITSGAERSFRYVLRDVARRQDQNGRGTTVQSPNHNVLGTFCIWWAQILLQGYYTSGIALISQLIGRGFLGMGL